MKQKLKLKIFLTVWVNYYVVLWSTFTSYFAFYFFYEDGSLSQSIFKVLFSTIEVIYFYFLFSVVILVIDLILPLKKTTKLNKNLFIEWMIISAIFFVGIIAAERYIFIAFVVPYLITQFTLRKKKIVEILENINQVSDSKIEELIK